MKPQAYTAARAIAGHEAMRVVEQWGTEEGEKILEGYAVAFARALCALKGVNETRLFLDKRLPRPDPCKLKAVSDV